MSARVEHMHAHDVAPSFYEKLNGQWHRPALLFFMLIVLAHWSEHLAQAAQIYILGWPIPESRGVLGQWFPWLIKSELLHYGYALINVGPLGISKGIPWTVAQVVDARPRHSVLAPH